MKLSSIGICLAITVASAYDGGAIDLLQSLTTAINQTTIYINNLEGCGYLTTTQALNNNATVKSGSVCLAADSDISGRLDNINRGLLMILKRLDESRQRKSGQATSNRIGIVFDDFALEFYTLFSAMDLAECTYVLTTASQSYAAQFGSGALEDSFNALVKELSLNPDIAWKIGPADLKQQAQFGNTSSLAHHVEGSKDTAALTCGFITTILTGEAGGSHWVDDQWQFPKA